MTRPDFPFRDEILYDYAVPESLLETDSRPTGLLPEPAQPLWPLMRPLPNSMEDDVVRAVAEAAMQRRERETVRRGFRLPWR